MNTPVTLRSVLSSAMLFAICVSAYAQDPMSSPRIVKTVFPAQDIVVADTIVTEKPYEADNSGEKDVTAVLQKALDDCATNGGGTVWMPAGTYKVSNTITIPEGCFLRGD